MSCQLWEIGMIPFVWRYLVHSPDWSRDRVFSSGPTTISFHSTGGFDFFVRSLVAIPDCTEEMTENSMTPFCPYHGQFLSNACYQKSFVFSRRTSRKISFVSRKCCSRRQEIGRRTHGPLFQLFPHHRSSSLFKTLKCTKALLFLLSSVNARLNEDQRSTLTTVTKDSGDKLRPFKKRNSDSRKKRGEANIPVRRF